METLRITSLMTDYGDMTRTQAHVVKLFRKKYPGLPLISQESVIKVEKQFR